MAFGDIRGLLLMILAVFLPLVYCSGLPAAITLERAFPNNQPINLTHLVERDASRHGRILSSHGVINNTLRGTSDLPLGLYYTRIQIGDPPGDYYVQFDTGVDLTWVWCISCTECRTWTGIVNNSVHLYQPGKSLAASGIFCHDKECPTPRTESVSCTVDEYNPCPYTFQYLDGTSTSGFYVHDLLTYYSVVVDSNRMKKSTDTILLGCSKVEDGFQPRNQIDGVFGFGRKNLSVISQLASKGKSPNAFSHCLRGDDYGGGALVLGQVVAPNIVYTPLIPSEPHYVLELQRLSVNGQVVLPINPSMLSATKPGARVDTGTTLVYLGTQVFDPFMNAIYASTTALLIPSSVEPCFVVTIGVTEAFPQVSFGFAQGAELTVGPLDYLLYQGVVNGSQIWCMGFRKNALQDQPTILGEILLRNKFFIYDLAGQRIGWTDYDCSDTANVSIRDWSRARVVRRSVPLEIMSWIMAFITILGWI